MNAEHTPKTYTTEERSRMNRSRHLSDHGLLFNGADYDGDRLALTADQVESIRGEHGDVASSRYVETYQIPTDPAMLGREMAQHVLTRPSAAYTESNKTQEQINAEYLNTKNLQEATELLLQPYESYYAFEVFAIPANRRTVMRGKLTNGSIVTKPQTDTISIDNIDVEFSTSLRYKPATDHNALQSAQIEIELANAEDTKVPVSKDTDNNPLTLSMEYSELGNMKTLQLDRLSPHGPLYYKMFENRSTPQYPISEFIVSMEPGIRTEEWSFSSLPAFDLQINLTDEPVIEVASRPERGQGYGPAAPMCEYRYDAANNEFALHNSTDLTKRPATITVEEYLKLLEAMLSLVPAEKQAI